MPVAVRLAVFDQVGQKGKRPDLEKDKHYRIWLGPYLSSIHPYRLEHIETWRQCPGCIGKSSPL
ncbi:hypothetical protein PTI98_002050 [Pleurotus ostreatus]|nr:hypothetical protein PTI98_002050 [Pleurotus ostreatus]